MRSTFYCLLCFLLSSCGSIHYLGIETYNPAEITFPEEVRKILVVNNAVPQPETVGYEYLLFGVSQDTCRVRTDSALFDATRALGKAIVDEGYFEDVLLYHEMTRTDQAYLVDTKLTQQQVMELCLANDAEAIISIDRLLFRMKKQVSRFGDGLVMGAIDVEITGIVRSYLPSRENSLATVLVNDSIFWAEPALHIEQLHQLLPDGELALRAAGAYMGAKIYTNFVPHWQEETRWYYTGPTSVWKEASAYVSTEKWDQAAIRWKSIYEKSSGWKDKAKSASNMALAYEVNTDLEKAHEWAGIAYELFKKNKGEEAKETRLQKLYMDTLSERIWSNAKLNIQFGQE